MSPARAYAGLAVASIGWATAFVVGKVVVRDVSPLAAASLRYGIAALVLLPLAVRGGHAAALRRVAVPLAIMTLTGGILYQWLFLEALARTSATNAALLVALNPVMTVLLAPLAGERLERSQLSGILLALAGAAIVITRGDPGALIGRGLNAGDLLALGGAVCWAGFNVAARPVVGEISPARANCIVYAAGAIVQGLLARDPLAQVAGAPPGALAGVLSMAILSSVMAGQLFLVGVRVVGVARSVVFVYLVPVLTGIMSSVLLGEAIEPSQGVGGVAVLAGVWLTTRR